MTTRALLLFAGLLAGTLGSAGEQPPPPLKLETVRETTTLRQLMDELAKDPTFRPEMREAWAKLSAEKKATVEKLLTQVRTVLPKGWKADYLEPLARLRIWREDFVITRPALVINGPAMMADEVEKWPETQIAYLLQLRPLVTQENFDVLQKKNRDLEAKIKAQAEVLNAMPMNRKFDSYMPRTPEQREAVAQYEGLKKALLKLPDFFFEDVSLEWDAVNGFGERSDERVSDPDIRAECANARKAVAEMLREYR